MERFAKLSTQLNQFSIGFYHIPNQKISGI
jgi:hypothetical protein